MTSLSYSRVSRSVSVEAKISKSGAKLFSHGRKQSGCFACIASKRNSRFRTLNGKKQSETKLKSKEKRSEAKQGSVAAQKNIEQKKSTVMPF